MHILSAHPDSDKAAWRNPWAPKSRRRRLQATERLARALEKHGSAGRAIDVRSCGRAMVAHTAAGDPITGTSGVPVAIVYECGHRLCPTCSRRHARKAASRICARLAAAKEARDSEGRRTDLRFITLTIPDRIGETAAAALDRLELHVRRFMRSVAFRQNVSGGILKYEIEWSDPNNPERRREQPPKPGRWWHAHAHIIAEGYFWAHDELLQAWRRVLTDSGAHTQEDERVRRRELKAYGGANIKISGSDLRGTAFELAKYVCKPLSTGLNIGRIADLLEGLRAKKRAPGHVEQWRERLADDLRTRDAAGCTKDPAGWRIHKPAAPRTGSGRRMLRAFGTLWGLSIGKEPDAGTTREEGFELDERDPGMEDHERTIGQANGERVTWAEVVWREDPQAQLTRLAILELLHDHHASKQRGPPI